MNTYEPLQEMITTGPARLDYEGCMIDSGEYVAALYESYAADHEWNEGETYVTRPERMPVTTWRRVSPNPDYSVREYGDALASLGSYCGSAQRLAEELWTRDLHDVQAAQETESDRYAFEYSTI